MNYCGHKFTETNKRKIISEQDKDFIYIIYKCSYCGKEIYILKDSMVCHVI